MEKLAHVLIHSIIAIESINKQVHPVMRILRMSLSLYLLSCCHTFPVCSFLLIISESQKCIRKGQNTKFGFHVIFYKKYFPWLYIMVLLMCLCFVLRISDLLFIFKCYNSDFIQFGFNQGACSTCDDYLDDGRYSQSSKDADHCTLKSDYPQKFWRSSYCCIFPNYPDLFIMKYQRQFKSFGYNLYSFVKVILQYKLEKSIDFLFLCTARAFIFSPFLPHVLCA